jgi:hypothetical protein
MAAPRHRKMDAFLFSTGICTSVLEYSLIKPLGRIRVGNYVDHYYSNYSYYCIVMAFLYASFNHYYLQYTLSKFTRKFYTFLRTKEEKITWKFFGSGEYYLH